MTEGFNWIYQDKPHNLSPKDRQEANIVSQQVKLQCSEMLQGNGVRIVDVCPDNKRATIWKENPGVNDREIDLGIMVETVFPNQTKKQNSAIEMFIFHTLGEYVIKETLSAESMEKLESHEANKSELEELLGVIERGK
jgi:hypothetical protein